MKLYAVDRKLTVLESHDLKRLTVVIDPGGDLQAIRDSVSGDDEAVVTRRLEWVGKSGKDPLTGMRNERSLAMHESVGSDNFCTVDFRQTLMTEADPQNREFRPKVFDEVF